MATGGQILSSEEAFDYNCTPCSQQERFIEAKRFCVECGEYFCSTCLSHHEKFSVTKGHTLIKCEEVSKEHVPTRLSKCEVHTDKEEDMVCCDHNVVCCRVCITTDHSSCQNVDYLPRLARIYKEDGKRLDLANDLKEKMGELKTISNDHTARVLRFETRKKTHLKRLEAFKRYITNFVDTVVANSEKDIEKQFETDICCMKEHIQKYSESLLKLNCLYGDLSSCDIDDIDECKKILESKRTLKEIQFESCVFDDKIVIDEEVQNEILKAIDNVMKEVRLFCIIKIVGFGFKFRSPSLCVKEEDPSVSVLLTDFFSEKIRYVTKDLTKSEGFDVEANIWGICEISNDENAFTLPSLMKVQFISAGKSPVLRSSFSTNLHCRGITCVNEKIYVTGGGMTGEEDGQVNVFDLNGKLLSKYGQDLKGKPFSIPRSIVVNTEGIYVTDQQNGIVCLDLEGKQKWVCKSSKCKFPFGLCFTPNGNILVSGRESNNIVIIRKDGELLGELLNEKDGLSGPMALAIDKQRNCIIISESDKNHLKMFYFDDENL